MFKAHRRVYHSTLCSRIMRRCSGVIKRCSRVIKKKYHVGRLPWRGLDSHDVVFLRERECCVESSLLEFAVRLGAWRVRVRKNPEPVECKVLGKS